jgi:thioredoxin-related protein
MKKVLMVILITLFFSKVFGQQNNDLPYNPKADAKKEINAAIAKAKKEGKHVLIQVGGNWCPWCIKMHKLLHSDKELNSALNSNYIYVTLNYSPDNYNERLMKQYEYPNRFGFPVILILDGNGKKLHTQNTSYLEEGNEYNKARMIEFFKGWTKTAIDPKTYEVK